MSGGLSGAMRAAVSGMGLKSQGMAAVGHNIANAGTTGFKGTLIRGESFVTTSSSSSSFSAGGVTAKTFREITKEGPIVSADASTDMGISGNGFFIVCTTSDPSTGTVLYTRAGSFRQDKEGYLRNDAGYYLLGFATDSSGVPTASDTTLLSNLEAVDATSLAGLTAATTQITDKATLQGNASNGDTFPQNVTVYDSLGISHTVTLTWTRNTSGDSAGTSFQWDLTATTADGTVTQGTSGGTSYSTGVPVSFSASNGALYSIDGSTASTAAAPSLYIDWTDGSYLAADSTIALDIGTVGSTSGVISLGTAESSTRAIPQDGSNFGNLASINVSEEGIMTAVFDNGLTRKFYKIPLALFPGANYLNEQDGQAYGATNDSGEVVIQSANAGGAGKINGAALEQSTVDIAEQFTTMIQLQQEFSANATVIRTADQMMAELTRLKS